MSEQDNQNKILVKRIYEEMWNQANPASAREIFAEPAGVEKFVSEFLAAFPGLQHTIEEMIVEGDRIAVRFSARGTHSGRWKHYPASGKLIYYSGVTLVQIEGGKVKHHHTWWDTLELIQQIS